MEGNAGEEALHIKTGHVQLIIVYAILSELRYDNYNFIRVGDCKLALVSWRSNGTRNMPNHTAQCLKQRKLVEEEQRFCGSQAGVSICENG